VIPTKDPTKATLTLVSCTPKYSAKHRIVVRAELLADRSDPLTEPVGPSTTPSSTLPDQTSPPETAPSQTLPGETAPATAPATSAAVITSTLPAATGTNGTTGTAEAFSGGWFSDTGGIPQALLWGTLLGLIGYGIARLSRAARRYWVGILAGAAPFVVVLYFFYENVNRLLPANL
jgi:sortase A